MFKSYAIYWVGGFFGYPNPSLTAGLSGNDARVFELITRHFLACVSQDAQGKETTVRININGEKFIGIVFLYFTNYSTSSLLPSEGQKTFNYRSWTNSYR